MTSANTYKIDMEEEDKTKYPPYQWIQQGTNSPIIKLELGAIDEKPGKLQMFKYMNMLFHDSKKM